MQNQSEGAIGPPGSGPVPVRFRPYEALGGVVHDAQLEALLVLEALGQRAAQRVGRQNLLTAELELGKNVLEESRQRVRTGPEPGRDRAELLVLTFRAQKMQESSRHLWEES